MTIKVRSNIPIYEENELSDFDKKLKKTVNHFYKKTINDLFV